MTIKLFAAVLAMLALVAVDNAARAAFHRAPAAASQGHQGVAPPWSFACMTDHGPSECGEPMWIYGN
jgi:hypothetical protein